MLKGLCGTDVGLRPTGPATRRTTFSVPHAVHKKVAAQHKEFQTSAVIPRARAFLPCTFPLILGSSALAEEFVDATTSTSQGFGLNPAEIVLLSAPPLLYGIFSLYRANVNDQAKLSDFLSILAATVIIGNIVSALVFKVRLY